MEKFGHIEESAEAKPVDVAKENVWKKPNLKESPKESYVPVSPRLRDTSVLPDNSAAI